jgi:nucleotide-binding universal stress UspA family protein
MDMISRILVAIDGSEPSFHALDYANEFAQKWNAELLILSVVPKVYYAVYPLESNAIDYGHIDYGKWENELEKIHKNILLKAEEKMKDFTGIKFKTILKFGRPHEKILEEADSQKVDLIIMGSRGLGGVIGILGSTSHRVTDKCKTPILITK